MPMKDKATLAATVLLFTVFFGGMFAACFVLVYDAWHYDDPPTEAQIRWDALDNEWDRNQHDPTQRPPDSIAHEARLKMLLLEEAEKQ
jgi:hypothetical protein